MRGEIFRYPSIFFAVAVCAGIAIASFDLPLPLSTLVVTALSILLIAFSPVPIARKALLPVFVAAGFASLFASLAALEREDNVARFAPARGAVIEGTVGTPIEYFPRGYRFPLKAEILNGHDVSGIVMTGMYAKGEPPFPGDRVRISNAYLKPSIGIRNFGGFRREEYLREKGITAQTNLNTVENLEILERAGRYAPRVFAEKLRRDIHDFIVSSYPRKEAALASGISIGVRGAIPAKERREFSVSGLAHLLAVAGLHVGFISGFAWFFFYAFFFYLFYWLNPVWTQTGAHRKWAAIFCILAVVLYVLVSGANVPAKRAGIMAAIYFLSVIFGREGELLNSLAISAVFVLLLDPQALFGFSFLMSYTAVGAIALLLGKEKQVEPDPLPEKTGVLSGAGRFLVETAKISLVLWFATMPLIMTVFNEVNLAALPANIISVPIALFAVPSVFVAWGLGAVWAPLGTVSVWFSSIGFSLIGSVAHLAGSSGFLSFTGAPPTLWLTAVFYSVFLIWAFKPRFLKFSAPLLAVLVLFNYWPAQREFSEVRFIDVGQGDSTLIMLKSGENILVDGGLKFGDLDMGEMAVLPELRRLGIRRLDAVIATHGDMDHVGGLFSVLRGVEVLRYFDNGEPHRALTGLRRIAAERDIPAFGLHNGMEVPVTPPSALKVLHPSRRFILEFPDSKNNNISLMLMLSAGGKNILLTADNEKEAERYLIADGARLKADVLKVAHHGSGSSSTPAFLNAVSPAIAVISVGRLNRYGMPAKKTMKALRSLPMTIYQTQYDGDVSLVLKGGGMFIRTAAEPFGLQGVLP